MVCVVFEYAIIFFRSHFQSVPRFKGYRQQDAHELLSYLLDVVRSEEYKRLKLKEKPLVVESKSERFLIISVFIT